MKISPFVTSISKINDIAVINAKDDYFRTVTFRPMQS